MRVASVIASVWSCVTYSMVAPSSRWMRLSSTRSSARSLASSDDSGSSIRVTAGWRTSARPIATRCICPPESCVARLASLSSMCSRRATSRTLASMRAPGPAPRRRAQRKGQVVVDRQMRIQRVLLEHERHVACRRRFARHVAPADVDAAGVGRFEPCEQPQGRGLAGAGRPEQDDELAVGRGKRQARRRPASARSAWRQRSKRNSAMRASRSCRAERTARPSPRRTATGARCATAARSVRPARAGTRRRHACLEAVPSASVQRDDLRRAEVLGAEDLGAQRRVARRARCARGARRARGRRPAASSRKLRHRDLGAIDAHAAAPRARPASGARHGRKFIAGEPMKSATNMRRRTVVDVLRAGQAAR